MKTRNKVQKISGIKKKVQNKVKQRTAAIEVKFLCEAKFISLIPSN